MPELPAPARSPAPLHSRSGVTLLELLAVMAILAVLAGFSISALQRVGVGTALDGAERVARTAILRARVSALREGAATEVLFEPGERPKARLVEAREVLSMSFDGTEGTKVLAGGNNFGQLRGGRIDEGGTIRNCAAIGGAGLVMDAVPAYEPTLGFTVECDFRPGSDGSAGPLVSFGRVFLLDVTPDDGLAATLWTLDTGDPLTLKTEKGVLARGVWSRVTFSYDGREALIRVKGAVEARGAAENFEQLGYVPLVSPNPTERLTFGGKGFAGHLDEVRYRTLRPAEALELGNLVSLELDKPLRLRFAPSGRLDAGFHKEAVTLPLTQEDTVRTLTVDLAGVLR